MNRIKQICNLIEKCDCVYDVGSDHALVAINLLKEKKVKQVVNIEKNWQPHNAGKANLAKNHLTTKTINVLTDGLKDISKKVFVQPNYVVIAGMGAKNIISILKEKDSKLNPSAKYLLEANCDIQELRKFLAINGWTTLFEYTCCDRTKYYQIICAQQGSEHKKITTFDAYFGKKTLQLNIETWKQYLTQTRKKIETKKLAKFSTIYAGLYKKLKEIK